VIRAVRLALALGLLMPQLASAQTAGLDQQPVILVVDVSGSMDEDDGQGTRKIDGAKLALLDYVGSVEGGSPIGLRTYPDQGSGSGCNRGQLEIPVGPANPEAMSARIRGLQPEGDTPTAEAMRAGVRDLQGSGAKSGTLVVVSDGESTCSDPCKAARDIADQGFDLDTITVGFRISDEGRKELRCISDALEGRYLDVDESDELRDSLNRLGRPRLEVRLDTAEELEVVAGGDYVDIGATVTNTGEIDASDVIGQISFRLNGMDVRRPVSRLGNLAPQASRSVTWRVRAGPSTAGKVVPYTVVGRSINALDAGHADGRLLSQGVKRLADAGDLMTGPGRGIAILGDSYSAGEGADFYEPETDTDANGCHRSELTYLVRLFARDDADVIACSGAVTNDITGPDDGNHVEAQIAQLREREDSDGPVKAVVLTLGGNDAGFPALAKSCLFGPRSCAERIFEGAPSNVIGNISRDDFVDKSFGEKSPLDGDLRKAYEAVHRTLNSSARVSEREGVAPILVLGYPIPVPLQGRTCAPMGTFLIPRPLPFPPRTAYALTPKEIDSIFEFAIKLNEAVESAVLTARAEQDVPVFYVASTEFSFLPHHTVCDTGDHDSATEPFARSVKSINGAGINSDTVLAVASPIANPLQAVARIRAGGTILRRSIQEIAHPNVRGYLAETLAILRWTRSKAAQDGAEFTRNADPVDPTPITWNVSQENLGQLDGRSITLQGGTTYPLTLDGFGPYTPLRIEAHSEPRLLATAETDEEGVLEMRVAIPRDLDDGEHTLEVSGADARGEQRVVRIPFEIDRPFRPPLLTSLAAGSALLLLLGLLLTHLSGDLRRWRSQLA
jgi:hypothetical protein